MRLANRNQTTRCDWIHFALAARNSDSDFAPDLSAEGLRIKMLGASSLNRKLRYEQESTVLNLHIWN
jgi:hypothetical protein